MEQNPLSDPKFYNITAFSTALALGCMLGFLVSLKDYQTDLSFQFSLKTVIWFVVGFAAGWGFWAWIRRMVARAK